MAGLCKGSNELLGSLKAICKTVLVFLRISLLASKLAPVLATVMVVVLFSQVIMLFHLLPTFMVKKKLNSCKPSRKIARNKRSTLEMQQASHQSSHQSALLPANEHAG
ncbi:hypothetical protein ANN_07652 [Periplaneta americana]|uniref:Uncharacterized protein n=1 Tax=Periplaneta americana TaxID=6978 RepID=A0ABQ8SZ65_PERAM|nr:hypothetical protein ANN_07652 [Periplaneta americana]